jgi:hypothetical protein
MLAKKMFSSSTNLLILYLISFYTMFFFADNTNGSSWYIIKYYK